MSLLEEMTNLNLEMLDIVSDEYPNSNAKDFGGITRTIGYGSYANRLHPEIGEAEFFFLNSKHSIRKGRIQCRSPWNNSILYSTCSIVFPTRPWNTTCYCYRFECESPFYLFIKGYDECDILGVLIPAQSRFIKFTVRGDISIRPTIADFRDWVVKYESDITKYVENIIGKSMCLMLGSYHFAHNLWNELSFVDGAINEVGLSEIFFLERHHPNGSLGDLFPELDQEMITDCKSLNVDEFHLETLRRNHFVVPLGRKFISDTLIGRITKVAESKYPVDVSKATFFHESNEIVLWVSTRHDVRIWKNELEVIGDIINKLCQEYESVGLIYDGYTLPTSLWNPNVVSSFLEQSIPQSIAEKKIPNLSLISLIGASLEQAYIWSAAADCYITHHGTPNHKIAWLRDIPGIVHLADQQGKFRPDGFGAIHARQFENVPIYLYGKIFEGADRTSFIRDNLQDYKLKALEVIASFKMILSQIPKRRTTKILERQSLIQLNPSYWRDYEADQLLISATNAWSTGEANACKLFLEAVEVSPHYGPALTGAIRFLSAQFGSIKRIEHHVPTQIFAISMFMHLGGSDVWGINRAIGLMKDIKQHKTKVFSAFILLLSRPHSFRETAAILIREFSDLEIEITTLLSILT
jgi:hypothetical protein